MNSIRFLPLALILALLPGCVSKPVEQKKEVVLPPLMIAQNGDGDVTIEWESEPGCFYTIYYQPSPDTDWKVLRKAHRLPGTGQRLAAYDRVNPNQPLRRYRVLVDRN